MVIRGQVRWPETSDNMTAMDDRDLTEYKRDELTDATAQNQSAGRTERHCMAPLPEEETYLRARIL
jgi:hypothetical protein